MGAQTPDVVIVAGGENRRLEELSGTLYKPFLSLRGASLVSRHIARCALAGARRVLVIFDAPDSLADRIVREAAGLHAVSASVAAVHHAGSPGEKVLRGHELLGRPQSVCVILGDSFARYDPQSLMEAAERSDVDSAISVADYRLPFGVVDEEGGRVRAFDEKPQTGYLVNTGHFVLGPDGLELLRKRFGLGETLGMLAERDQLAAVRIASDFVTVDSIKDIAAAFSSELLLDGSVATKYNGGAR